MAGAERVIHIAVRQGSQFLGELLDVLGFFLAEAGVLQQHDVAVLHRRHSSLCVVADHRVVIGEHDGLTQQFAQANRHGCQRELLFRAVLRLAQMAAQDDLCAVSDQLLDGRKRGHDALVVGDLAVLHGDVEVTANQHLLARNLDVVNRFLSHC